MGFVNPHSFDSGRKSFKRRQGTADDPIDLDMDSESPPTKKDKSTSTFSSSPQISLPSSSQSLAHSEASTSSISSSFFSPFLTSSTISFFDSDSDSDIEVSSDYSELNQVMKRLDSLSRFTFMRNLKRQIQSVRDELDAFVPLVDNFTATYNSKLEMYEERVEECQSPQERVDSHDRCEKKPSLEALHKEINFLGDQLDDFASNLDTAKETQESFKRWIAALEDHKENWTRIWDVYDRLNEPGPSYVSAELNSLWQSGYGMQLKKWFEKTEERARVLEEGVRERLACLRSSNYAEV